MHPRTSEVIREDETIQRGLGWLVLLPVWMDYGVPWLSTISGVSVRVPPDEIGSGIWIGRLSSVDGPPHCRWASFNPQRAWIEQKGGARADLLSLLQLRLISSVLSLDIVAPGSQAFKLTLGLNTISPSPMLRPLISNWIIALTFLTLQLSDSRSWNFSASSKLIPIINLLLYISLYIFLVLYLWRILTIDLYEELSFNE